MAEKLEIWITPVEQQKNSGLSAASWCRENGVVYSKFLYWRERIAQQTAERFVELEDSHRTEGGSIELEVMGMTVRLATGFASADLLRCLRVIGSVAC